MQYHYVIFYDTETKEFRMDFDTMSAKFDDWPVFDTTASEWAALDDDHWANDDHPYNKAADTLFMAIRDLKLAKDVN